jgi:uncharacterized membrane protein YcfT
MNFSKGNITAIAFGLIALAPQIQQFLSLGFEAFQACKAAALPLFSMGMLLSSAIVALFSKSVVGER